MAAALQLLLCPVHRPQAQELQGQGWTIVDVRLAGDFDKVGHMTLPLRCLLIHRPV